MQSFTDAWSQITSHPEILSLVTGTEIEFDSATKSIPAMSHSKADTNQSKSTVTDCEVHKFPPISSIAQVLQIAQQDQAQLYKTGSGILVAPDQPTKVWYPVSSPAASDSIRAPPLQEQVSAVSQSTRSSASPHPETIPGPS